MLRLFIRSFSRQCSQTVFGPHTRLGCGLFGLKQSQRQAVMLPSCEIDLNPTLERENPCFKVLLRRLLVLNRIELPAPE